MKRVCAWCGGEMDPSDGRQGLKVTHGVCPSCRGKFFASAKTKQADSPSFHEDRRGESQAYKEERES